MHSAAASLKRQAALNSTQDAKRQVLWHGHKSESQELREHLHNVESTMQDMASSSGMLEQCKAMLANFPGVGLLELMQLIEATPVLLKSLGPDIEQSKELLHKAGQRVLELRLAINLDLAVRS